MNTPYTKPMPGNDPLMKPYWDALNQRMLTVQRCEDCGDRHFPPSPVCPKCLSESQDWEVVSGKGTLMSWVRFHRAYWPGFKETLPYDVCVVRLDEGPVVVGNLAGPLRDDWQCGMAVRVVFETVTEGLTLTRFERQ